MSAAKEYLAYPIKHIDGDTFECVIDLSFDVSLHRKIRLNHIDAYEKNTPAGKEAAQTLAQLLPLNEWFFLRSDIKLDKFGRTLATVVNSKGINVNEELVRLGLAKPYEGGKR